MLENHDIAELLVQESLGTSGTRSDALLNAAREAMLWPEEAHALVSRGESLAGLAGLRGTALRLVMRWLEAPPTSVPIPPKSRQEFLTMARAKAVLAKHGRKAQALNGDLQMHSQWSDGSDTIVQMAAAAIERGYSYIAMTDHTAGLTVAHGMDETRVAAQAREIAQVNGALEGHAIDFTVLHAVEMNLSDTGTGDVKPSTLKKLDLVLGSFHSGLSATRDQTSRYLAALRNPHVHILGHPQTRRWNKRPGLQADWSRVFAEAARLGKAVEVDGYAERQDLRLSLLKIAKTEGALISLGSDAHRQAQLAYMDFALASVFLAGIPTSRVLNFWPAEKLVKWAAEHRSHA
jgi:histidinol phosphatase-like PHP family hydrolase